MGFLRRVVCSAVRGASSCEPDVLSASLVRPLGTPVWVGLELKRASRYSVTLGLGRWPVGGPPRAWRSLPFLGPARDERDDHAEVASRRNALAV